MDGAPPPLNTDRNESVQSEKLTAQPLYAKVRTKLVDRLISGQWKPGMMLPSEFAIADELGVSQGTVRKALDEMTTEGLLRRMQGRGTFVAEAEDTSVLFRFYRLTRDNPDNTLGFTGESTSFPESTYLKQEASTANAIETSLFGIKSGDPQKVWHIERLRSDEQQPILWEQLSLPSHKFPELEDHFPLPNNVYQLYGHQFGIIVAKVQEKLRAIVASDEICQHLGLPKGSAVLEIDRRAIALNGETVEWRISLCRSDTMHYRNELK